MSFCDMAAPIYGSSSNSAGGGRSFEWPVAFFTRVTSLFLHKSFKLLIIAQALTYFSCAIYKL